MSVGGTGSKGPSLAPSSVIITLVLALPAVGSLLLLQAKPSYLDVLVSGSPHLLLQNVGLLLLLPYLVSFFAGVGFAALCLAQHLTRRPVGGRDFELALLGVALVVPLGFCLGLFGLLKTWLVVPLFIAGLLVYLHSRVTPRLVRWRSRRHTQVSARNRRPVSGTIVWGVVAVLIVALTLRHGLVLEATSDVLQLYIPYFDNVAATGSTLLERTDPRLVSFLTGRGVGPQLIVSTFASGYSIQVLSISLLIILGLAMRGFFLQMLQPIRGVNAQISALIASAAMSATLAFGLTSSVFGKYHVLTLFLIVALGYFSVALASESDRRVVHTTGATACAIALPILYLPNLVFVLVALACVVTWAIAAQRTKGLTWQVLPLFGAVCASIISGWVNFKVVGVAGLEVGAREWVDYDLFSSLSSWPLWQYVNDIQGLTGPMGGFLVDLPTEPGQFLFRLLYPLVNSGVILTAAAIVFYPARCFGQRQWWRLVTFLGSLCLAWLFNAAQIFAISFVLAVLLLEAHPVRLPLQRANSLLLSSRLRFSPQYLLLATFLLSAMLLVSPWVAQPSLYRFLDAGRLALFLIPFVLISVGLVWSLRSRPSPVTSDSSLESPATRAAGEQRTMSLSRRLALPALIWGFAAIFNYGKGGEVGTWLILLVSIPAIVPLIIGPRVRFTSGAALHPTRLQGDLDPSWNGVIAPTVAIVLIQALFGLGLLPSTNYERSMDKIRTFSATYADSASVAAGLRGTLSSPILSPLFTALDAHRCQEIAALSPVSQALFPINGNLTLSICHGNAELASRPFVHHYESRLAPYYNMITVGTPEEVAQIFRKLDINYFVLLDNDCDFWSFGLSQLFSNASLYENFTPHSRGTDFTILTLNPEDSPRPQFVNAVVPVQYPLCSA